MSTRRHWWHCTQQWHGERWIAQRRAPRNIGFYEPKTPRLCVAASVARCFAARLFNGDVYVYRTEKVRRSVAPRDVHDSLITQERWLIPPVSMIFTDVIPAAMVELASGPTRRLIEDLLATHVGTAMPDIPGLTYAKRAQCFLDAVRALGPNFCHDSDLNYATLCVRLLSKKEAAA